MDDELQIEEIYRKSPLLAFSVSTVVQLQSLQRMQSEIEAALDRQQPGPDLLKAYDFFWFWTLGAYEIVRTMDENRSCFSSLLAADTNALKLRLAVIRMPFAKQQLVKHPTLGKRPIRGEDSIADVRDKSLIFEIDGETFDSRSLMREVAKFFAGIKREAVLQAIPTST
ncbi:hypothetical protein [Mesorhizobium ventifaucium]|uniref:Uncharacterized protein n=1 Tax=Mesorhizobium ventifaucium TaxID=666020 RepID=A0ABN8JU34_9HYPH|nr:hypothetical protein [Mesorhizobium ventifaucium]CAH2400529.1 conserved hypothetical protein [Mesorhizobium ventifaucium]